MSALDEASQVVSRAVDFYERGIISLALLWNQLVDVLNLRDFRPVLDSLPTAQQVTLRKAYAERPLSLRSEGRDDAVRQEIERWCRTPPSITAPVDPPLPAAVPKKQPPLLVIPLKRVEPPPPERPWEALRALYRAHGYVRRPRIQPGQESDWEVRFVFHYVVEVKAAQRLLAQVGFGEVPVFRRYGYPMLSLPGRKAVERILNLMSGSVPVRKHPV